MNGRLIPIEVKAGVNLKSKSLSQYISKHSPIKAYRFSLKYNHRTIQLSEMIYGGPVIVFFKIFLQCSINEFQIFSERASVLFREDY